MGVQALDLSSVFPERSDCLSASKMKKYVDESSKPEAMDYINPGHDSNICKLKTGALSFGVLTQTFGVLTQNSDVTRPKQEWCKYQPAKSVTGQIKEMGQVASQQEEQPQQPQEQQVVRKDNSNTGVAFLSSSSSSVICMFIMMMMMMRR